jgi:peptidoglycan/LPS O-acetylase OafA/YrhL
MFTGGGAGVIVFFMISGYIILYVLQKELPLEFLIKRIFRIYPLLIFAIFIQVILSYVVYNTPINIHTTLLQMSLMGDFFNTPYALSGVEWTLRVEIMFYVFMFILSFTPLLHNKGYVLLLLFTALILSLKMIAPFPNENFIGYFSTHIPFLFLGSVIYMYEKKNINLLALLLFIGITFYTYFKAIEEFSPQWLQTNFAITGFGIFIILWLIRENLQHIPTSINLFINKLALLTFSVYLFHLFLWSYIELLLEHMGLDSSLFILIILFMWCRLMYLFIETPMNRLGQKLSKSLVIILDSNRKKSYE